MVKTRCLLAATRHHCGVFWFWVGDPACAPETIGTPFCPQQADDDHCGRKTGPYDACCVLVANGCRRLDMSGPVPRSNTSVCLSITRRGRGDVETPPQPGRTQARRRLTSRTPCQGLSQCNAGVDAVVASHGTSTAELARRRFFPFAPHRCRLDCALRGPGRRPSSAEEMSLFAVTAGWMAVDRSGGLVAWKSLRPAPVSSIQPAPPTMAVHPFPELTPTDPWVSIAESAESKGRS